MKRVWVETLAKFGSPTEFEAWLESQPSDVSFVLASRSVLRVAPLFAELVVEERDQAAALVLTFFRATAVPWYVSIWPKHGTANEVRPAAHEAARAAHKAARAALAAARAAAHEAARAAHEAARAALAAAHEAARAAHEAALAAAHEAAHEAAHVGHWSQIEAEATMIMKGVSPAELSAVELWRGGAPGAILENWLHLKSALLSLDADWHVWTDWYEDRLAGANAPTSRPLIEELERNRILIPNKDWRIGPAHVNAVIAKLEAKYRSETPETSSQSNPTEGGGDAEDDRLIEGLLAHRLAVSTLAGDDLENAISLIGGPERWGLGPTVDAGDILLVYFPKSLAGNSQLQNIIEEQNSGLRFLLRAAAPSESAGPEEFYRQVVRISESLELPQPIVRDQFTSPPLSDWKLAKANFRRAGQENEPLTQDLSRALWHLILETNPEILPTLESWVGKEQTPPNVSTHATSDLWTVDDKLGYAEYARAIYHFLNDPRTEPPVTISIQAPWGGGKTSLMRMIQKQLDPQGYERWSSGRGQQRDKGQQDNEQQATTQDMDEELDKLANQEPTTIGLDLTGSSCASVWFNAWQYQSQDQIWAGLAEAIVRGITNRLKPLEREKFLLRLHLSRVNADVIRSKIYDAVFRHFVDLMRRLGLWVAGGIILIVAGLWSLLPAEYNPQTSWIVALLVGIGGTIAAFFRARAKAASEPAEITLSDYVDVPNYSEKLGLVHHVTKDLRRVFELMPLVEVDGEKRCRPLVIFIDDLDRCAPAKVAEVFEAINLFIAGDFPDCYIVIGMDTEVVAAALEEAHKNVIQRLPSYARRVPVGWRFMDKFVQLPFVIPPLDEQALANYSDHLAAAENRAARVVQARAKGDRAIEVAAQIRTSLDRGEDESKIAEEAAQVYAATDDGPQGKAREEGKRIAEQQIQSIKRQGYIDERARDALSDSEKIQSLLSEAKNDFSNNPRELKRLVNVYRFYYNLRLARLSFNQDVPTETQLQNWLKLSLAWPEVVRWLRLNYTEWESDRASDPQSDVAVGHRLARLEELTITPIRDDDGADPSDDDPRAPTIKDWANALHAEFGLPKDVPWLEDERLFSFLRGMASAEETERLSKGAGKGFW